MASLQAQMARFLELCEQHQVKVPVSNQQMVGTWKNEFFEIRYDPAYPEMDPPPRYLVCIGLLPPFVHIKLFIYINYCYRSKLLWVGIMRAEILTA